MLVSEFIAIIEILMIFSIKSSTVSNSS